MDELVTTPNLEDLIAMEQANALFRQEVEIKLDGRSFIGEDVKLITLPTALPPLRSADAYLLVPKGYFQELVSKENEQILLYRTIIHVIVRSKASQAGLYMYMHDPNINRTEMDISAPEGYNIIRVKIENRHPSNTISLPEKLQIARLGILENILDSNKIFQLGKNLASDVLFVAYTRNPETGCYQYDAYDKNDLQNLTTQQINNLHLTSIALKLEKMSLLQSPPRVVSLAQVLSQQMEKREVLDTYLCNDWEEYNRAILVKYIQKNLNRFILLETQEVHIPNGCMLTIFDPQHAGAILIDQGFKGKIRLEVPVGINMNEFENEGLPSGYYLFRVNQVL